MSGGAYFGNGVMTYGGEFGDESKPIHLEVKRLDYENQTGFAFDDDLDAQV